MRLTTDGKVALWLFCFALLCIFGMFALAAASSPCVESGPLLWPAEQTGWRGDVRCYHGQVVDFR